MNEEEKLKQIIIKVGGDYEYIRAHPKENYLVENWIMGKRFAYYIFWNKKELNINIPENMIINGEFDTYEGIEK